MGDRIESLPTDNEPLTAHERALLNTLLDPPQSRFETLMGSLKTPLCMGVLFLLLGSPQASGAIERVVPYSRRSPASLLVVKTALFVALLFALNNSDLLFRRN